MRMIVMMLKLTLNVMIRTIVMLTLMTLMVLITILHM